MSWKIMIVVVLAIGIILGGCTSSNAPPSGYYGNAPQGGQPSGGQYVGGGCGVVASNEPIPNLIESSSEA